MLAGRLRDRITILTRTFDSGPAGRVEVWSESYSLWGRLTLARITTRMAFAQANQPTITHFATFRDEIELSQANNRLRCEGKDYEIVAAEGDISDVGKFTRVEVRLITGG